jgi:hypothetical protein
MEERESSFLIFVVRGFDKLGFSESNGHAALSQKIIEKTF